MANTYTLIASNTVGGAGAASVTFNSIPSTYTDLLIKASTRVTGAGRSIGIDISFNGSTASFTAKYLYGDGASAGSYSGTTVIADTDGAVATSNTFGSQEIYIPNYAGSTNKSYSNDGVQEDNQTTAYASLIAGLRSNTAAITSLTFTPVSGSFVQYSNFYLYGINNS